MEKGCEYSESEDGIKLLHVGCEFFKLLPESPSDEPVSVAVDPRLVHLLLCFLHILNFPFLDPPLGVTVKDLGDILASR